MKSKKRQKLILLFWKHFKDNEKPTMVDYFSSQPRIFWIGIIIISLFYSTDFYFCGFNELLTGMFIAIMANNIGLYFRFKRDWPTLNQCIDWNKVEKLYEESTND